MLKFKDRSDLKHNYARIRIKRNGNTVDDIPGMISDPGPTSESDYLQLMTGETYIFEHDGLPLDLTELRSGVYIPLPSEWNQTGMRSPSTQMSSPSVSSERDGQQRAAGDVRNART